MHAPIVRYAIPIQCEIKIINDCLVLYYNSFLSIVQTTRRPTAGVVAPAIFPQMPYIAPTTAPVSPDRTLRE
jgi:hypothetical protein